jgi:hypothetical protein
VRRGRRFWELGAWIEDLFTTTLLGDGRSSTDSPRHRIELRRFISFLVLFLVINGFYGPRTVRKHIFGLFRKSRLEIVLI